MHLKGAGLVHNPNLYLTALASQETPMLPPNKPQTPEAADLVAALAKLLNLPADTPAEDLMAKVAELLKAPPDPAKFVPIEAVQDMMSDQRSERATLSAGRATDKVNAAVRQGYLTNGMRDWALSLCASDEAAFDSFLAKAGPTFAYLLKPSHTAQAYIGQGGQRETHADSEMEAAVCAQLGLKPGTLAS